MSRHPLLLLLLVMGATSGLAAASPPAWANATTTPDLAASPAQNTATATTPPLMALGLIPVEALDALSLVHESFVVSPRQDGCEVHREVRVRCRGGAGTYRVAIRLLAPDGTTGGLDSTIEMSLDGVPQELLIYEDGYDAGPGTWAEMDLPIARNATRTVDIDYRFQGDPAASADFARAQLGIHTQTFWANNVVPRIDARLALGRSGFTPGDFEPRDAVSGPCVLDLQSEGRTLVWKIRSYRRSSWNRSTTDWLARPPGTPPASAADPTPPGGAVRGPDTGG